jgi:dipeptidyl aminopeptidase/acylaminoacyl peptidase
VAQAAARPGNPRVDGDTLYWLEARPAEGGRFVVVRQGPAGGPRDLTPPGFNVRSRVHEYGGGAYTVFAGTVYFVNQSDQQVYRQGATPAPSPLTAPGPRRYADLVVDAPRRRLVCVAEEHAPGAEPRAALVTVPLDASGDDPGRTLASGADFFASPRLSADGARLAWLTWDHPDMPWDATRLWVARFAPDGGLHAPRLVAGGPGESVFQPEWGPDGSLYFISDRSGWWNLYRWRDGAVVALAPMEAEFGLPQWVFGMSTYAVLSDGTLACAFARDGTWHLARLDPGLQTLREVPTGYTVLGDLAADGLSVVATAAGPTDGPALVRIAPGSGRCETLQPGAGVLLTAEWVAPALPLAFPTGDATDGHALLYLPRNPAFTAPVAERPPLLVRCHGGPTAAATPAYDPLVQFWTTRGLAFLDVNYAGSTGYGRAHRRRLEGRWGVADVDDCVAAARHLAALGQVDAARLAIRGSSAGGFTALCALAFRDVFRAGAVYYGVSDLESLARDTHKFESRYLDRLIGPYPETAETYRARSPLRHAHRITAPVLFFQGLEDRVVPPDQTERMVAALKASGTPVTYLAFPNEAHGFRQAQSIAAALEAELGFYGEVFGFTPGGVASDL